jgi:hypothetical protein
MPATQPHVGSGVLDPTDAESTIDRHASRPARSHTTLDLNALQHSPAPITPRSASTMSSMKPGRGSRKNPIRSNVIEMRRGLLQDTQFVPSPHLATVFQTLASCSMINFELLFI